MRLSDRGFAISSIFYIVLVLFLILIAILLIMMSGRKNILDKMRRNTYNDINNVTVSP